MSAIGSPSSTTRSASLPDASTPRSSSLSSAAALEVALVIACIGVRPASTISEFQMLGHARNAQPHAGIGAEADPDASIMDRFQILLIGGDSYSVLRGRWHPKRALAIVGII